MSKKVLIRSCHSRYRFIKSLAPRAVVLDIGAGNGQMQERLLKCRSDLNFLSVDKEDYSTIFQCGKFFQADLCFEDLPMVDNNVDAVFCSHVVEHLPKYEHLLSEIRRVLKPTGSVYIEAPSTRSLLVPSFWGHGGTINFYDDPSHIRPYTREALYRMGRTVGLKQIKTGVARNWLYCLLAPLILFYSIIKRDRRMLGILLWSIVGWSVYIWGKNLDK